MSKYHNHRVVLDGVTWDSQKEADRYLGLKLLQQAGRITELRWHVPFQLRVRGELICTYVADFFYREQGREIVEDVKSPATRTPVYVVKRKLMHAIFGITIRET